MKLNGGNQYIYQRVMSTTTTLPSIGVTNVWFARGVGRFTPHWLSAGLRMTPTLVTENFGLGSASTPPRSHSSNTNITSRWHRGTSHSCFKWPDSLLPWFARNEAVVWLIKDSSCFVLFPASVLNSRQFTYFLHHTSLAVSWTLLRSNLAFLLILACSAH